MRYLLLLLILLPVAEITVLLAFGKAIGIWATLSLILLTAVIGAFYARKQGLETIRRVQEQIRYGEMPGETLLEGVCILAAGVLLLLPGFITDLVGIVLLLPPARSRMKSLIMKQIRKRIDKRTVKVIY